MNRCKHLLIGGVAAMSLLLSCENGPLVLADGGESEYVIVVSSQAMESEQHAAREFSRLLALSRVLIVCEHQRERYLLL